VSWEVYRAKVGVGVQADGTFVVASQPGGKEAAQARAATDSSPIRSALLASPDPTAESPLAHSGMAAQLRDRTNMLVGVLAACQAHAKQFHPGITPDDVRACLLAACGMKGGK